jgi:nitrogen regulatory protein P-II 2
MEFHSRKLVVVIAEATLERALVSEAKSAGASGYTIAEVRGGGLSGERAGDWEGERSIELKILCDAPLAETIAERIMSRYAKNFSLVLYITEAQVVRGARFP